MFRLSVMVVMVTRVASFLDEPASLESRMAALEEKYVELQRQMHTCSCPTTSRPAFMASLSTTLNQCTKDQPVIFDSVSANVGGGYNNHHGVFTAPVSGTYVFSAHLTAAPQLMYHVAFVKNTPASDLGYMFQNPLSVFATSSNTILTHLNASEEVWVVCLDTSSIFGGYGYKAGTLHSHLTGFLVSED